MDIFNALLTKLLVSQEKALCQLKLTALKAMKIMALNIIA
jgi:hypothetical protein